MEGSGKTEKGLMDVDSSVEVGWVGGDGRGYNIRGINSNAKNKINY